jgi:hypothetical protein
MDNAEANGVLDLIELEAANHSRCKTQAMQAVCASEAISCLSAALESAHGGCELAGRLRDHHPDAADNLVNRWRDEAARLTVLRHRVVETRRAELAEFSGVA